MEEADALCQRLAIVDHGHIIALGTPQELKASIPGGFLLRLRFGKQPPDLLAASAISGGRSRSAALGRHRRRHLCRPRRLPDSRDRSVAASAGAELSDVHISEPSLENLFLHHTGRSLRD